MSLWDVRERRKQLGPGAREGPGTPWLVALLVLVLLLIFYLDQFA